MNQMNLEGGEWRMERVNTGLSIDKRIKRLVDECARETARKNNFRKRTEWGFSRQVEAMLARDFGVELEPIQPVFPSVKPSRK